MLVDEDDAVRDVLERLGRVRALLRLREQARVVERERDAAGQLRCHFARRLVEARLLADGAEADRTERAAAGHERSHDA